MQELAETPCGPGAPDVLSTPPPISCSAITDDTTKFYLNLQVRVPLYMGPVQHILGIGEQSFQHI